MKFKTRALGALAGVSLLFLAVGVTSAADRPYTEGTVTDVTSVRTQPGMFDEYMAWLAGPYKQAMEAQKAAGIIVSYAVYVATPRSPNDPDLYLTTTYKNMAALDGLVAKLDPIYEKMQGSLAEQNKAYAARSKLRTILGEEYIREMKLK
jgi:predicted metal-dependent phosphoesterase TrpH